MPSITKQSNNSKSKVKQLRSAWDLTEGIKVLLYGQSGSGKTTFWATFPKPILAIICSGGKNPGELKSIDTPEYRKTIDPRIIENTSDILELLKSAGDYKTVVLDHVSGLQDFTLKEILGLEEIPAQKSWGLATQQEYGQSTLQCKEYLRSLLNLPDNVVIIGQERVFGGREDGVPSDVIQPTIGVSVTPSLAGWLNPACDYVLQMFRRPKMVTKMQKVNGKEIPVASRGKGVEYCARTEPHDIYMTKFRVPKGLVLPEVIVDPDYVKLSALIRGSAK